MFASTTKIEGLSHPLINSAYCKKDYWGSTLIIDTNFSNENRELRNEALNVLLADLQGLIDHVESNTTRFDTIDIRLNALYSS